MAIITPPHRAALLVGFHSVHVSTQVQGQSYQRRFAWHPHNRSFSFTSQETGSACGGPGTRQGRIGLQFQCFWAAAVRKPMTKRNERERLSRAQRAAGDDVGAAAFISRVDWCTEVSLRGRRVPRFGRNRAQVNCFRVTADLPYLRKVSDENAVCQAWACGPCKTTGACSDSLARRTTLRGGPC